MLKEQYATAEVNGYGNPAQPNAPDLHLSPPSDDRCTSFEDRSTSGALRPWRRVCQRCFLINVHLDVCVDMCLDKCTGMCVDMYSVVCVGRCVAKRICVKNVCMHLLQILDSTRIQQIILCSA